MLRAILFSLSLSLATAGPALAAEIEEADALTDGYFKAFPSETMEGLTMPGQPFSFANHRHIRVSGDIMPGDVERLAALLGPRDPFALIVISFDSLGGDYRVGLALADVITKSRAATFVGPDDTCLSACGLAFLGGTEELIRGVVNRPNRYVHTQARLGFHAPFNTTYPTLPTVNDQTMRFVADLFYGQAREAIRLLQSRIRPLSLNPDFVFEMLGKGPDEFLFIDRYREASQNQITVLTDRTRRPAQMGATAAKLACGFMLEAAISPAEGFTDVIASGNWTDIADSQVLANASWPPAGVAVEEVGSGRATFTIETILAGRGPFTCIITNARDGIWRGSLAGDVPTVPGRMGVQMDVTRGGDFELSDFTVLGSYLPWSAMGADDLIISGPEQALYEQVPESLRRDEGPSFDCGGTLDPAAQIICRFPRLAQADATMVAIYLAKRDEGVDSLLDGQRAWLRERDAFCRPQATSLEDPFELTLTGYCLLESTLARVSALLRL
jgi:uncharacterized protein YecT (DUF1311 family)